MATVTWKDTTSRRGRRTSRAGLLVDVLPQHAVVLLVDADRVRDRVRLAVRVVQHGVEVADLAEAVAAQLQRGGHEAQAPLADVERGAAVVVGRRVAVGHDHLGEGQPVRDRAQPAAVGVADGVQHQALAVVEARAACDQFCQRSRWPSRVNEAPSGWVISSGLRSVAQRAGRARARGRTRPCTGGRPRRSPRVLDVQQLHRVQVDDRVQPVDRVRVRVAARAWRAARCRPADPAVRGTAPGSARAP